jgi:hypothetical protein
VGTVRKILTGLALLAPLASAADPALLDFIMPDARLVVGVDIAHMRSSPLNTTFTSGVQGANPELQKLMDAAGFDPMRDLQELVFASPGIGKNPPALLVARGNFDTAKLRAFAESAGSKITDFKGVPLMSDPEKDNGTFALLDNIILAGNREQVKAAIERRGQGRILNTEMSIRIADVSRRYDAWLVSIAPLATMSSALPADAKIDGLTSAEALRSIEQFSIGISLKSDLAFAAEMIMTNAQAAGSMADGLQMMMAMAQQGAKDQPAVMNALKNVKLGVEQNVVHVGMTVPVEELEKAVRSAMDTSKKSGSMTAARRPEAVMPTIQQTATPVEAVPAQAEAQPEPQPQAGETAAPAEVSASAPAPAPKAVPASAARSPRIPSDGEILIQSSPKDMGTVVILGSKK